MVLFIILAVFIAGLMVGRTPEYLGKKIEPREMKAVMAAVLSFSPCWSLAGRQCAAVNTFGTDTSTTLGPHGLLGDPLRVRFRRREQRLGVRRAEREHAPSTTSASGSTCSSAASSSSSRDGDRRHDGAKKRAEPGPGTFPTDGVTFGGLLSGVIVIVGLLTFFPVARSRPHRRASAAARRAHLLGQGHINDSTHMAAMARSRSERRSRSVWTREIVRPRTASTRCASSTRVTLYKNPDHPHRRDRRAADVGPLRARPRPGRWLRPSLRFELQISLWLWFTVLFANFAEAIAEGRGKAQADTLRRTRTETAGSPRKLRRHHRDVAGQRAAARRHRPRRVGRS